MLEIAGLVVATSMIVGQAESTDSPQKHLEELSWLIGRWEGEYTLPDGIEDVGKPGSLVKDEASFRWILDKKFIQLDFVRCIMERAGPHSITQGNGNIVFKTDI